ncbi:MULTISPECIES: DegT/DnrJ/EryC1/StrS aminotransferase family protein [unclassified Alteromonas]|uniref:DegT/DnrJ/EryC1/StrS aminotransferase family protein n=1 Tax=unclassified Alteromonas TaxID=2614992 RepID=UPI000509FC56|nr:MULTISPECIES: DegT/DnrJ/EryC1/StrS family aminotransferase [unclassified Alteromonas]
MKVLLNKPFSPCLKTLQGHLERVNSSGWYTNFGPLHEELTAKLESYLGVSNLLLVSNGTLAIQVAAKVLGVKKAVTTPFSFAATSTSLLWQGVDVSYSDIDAESLNICPTSLEATIAQGGNFDGIVATHVYGNPCDVRKLSSIGKSTNTKVIYDAAHAFGIKCLERSVLSYGDASTLSFHATKLFHTVEGGAIIFRDSADYLKAKELINFGIKSNGELTDAGINAKLNEYQCAVGLTVFEKIEQIVEHRSHLFSLYMKALGNFVGMPSWHSKSNYNGAYMPILLKDSAEKEKVKQTLIKNGIQCRDYFSPSLNTIYKPDVEMPISESISKRVLCLPLHFYLTEAEVTYVCDTIKVSLS